MSDGKAPGGLSRKKSRYTLEPTTSALTTLREFLKATLTSHPLPEADVQDIVFATHEAAKNAVIHNPDPDGPVDVTCEISDSQVVVEVSDRGRGYDTSSCPCDPDPEALAGRGLFLMRALMDAVETHSDKCGTRVTLVKRIQPAASRA